MGTTEHKKLEYRLYRTDKNSYISLLIEEGDEYHYFIYTRLRFICKKALTRGAVRCLLGLGGHNSIISMSTFESDYYFFEWLFKHDFRKIKLIRGYIIK